jgi:hypothetical protein
MNPDKPRTNQQSKSIHLYLELKAKQLNEMGITLQDVLERIQTAEIIPTKENLKLCVWKPMMKALYSLESTKELDRKQPDKVHEMMEWFFAKHWHTEHIPWPSNEDLREDNT